MKKLKGRWGYLDVRRKRRCHKGRRLGWNVERVLIDLQVVLYRVDLDSNIWSENADVFS